MEKKKKKTFPFSRVYSIGAHCVGGRYVKCFRRWKYQTKHLNKSWDKTMCTLNSILPPPTSTQRAHLLSKGLRDGEMLWCLDWTGLSDFMGSQESCYVFVQKHNKNMSHTARSKQADAWRRNEKWMLPGSYPDPKVGAQSGWATFSITPTWSYSLCPLAVS